MKENESKENEDLIEENNSEDETQNINQEDAEEHDLEELLKSKDKENKEVKEQLLRLQADFMNFRRRAEKEKQDALSYGLESFICDILPTIDNFQRALNGEEEKESGFYQGVEMIYNELMKKLNDNEIQEIKSLGEDFDPNFHHAVIMEESDEFEEGKVIEVLQTGYMLKDKVIRPSMVKVAK